VPSPRQLPVVGSCVPAVYETSSGWGIRLDMTGKERHGDLGMEAEVISMPPEHWRYTVLNILHFTEAHYGEGDSCDECPKCAAIARAIQQARGS
jgi:hypothetical protein